MLAELDGFEQRTTAIWVNKDESKKFWYFFNQHGEMEFSSDAPKYLTSYDAIIPLVQKLCDTHTAFTVKFVRTICMMSGVPLDSYPFMLSYTPSQLCDAVLVATGKAIV